jgi:predicted GIY-YIG superfamily endonuclease
LYEILSLSTKPLAKLFMDKYFTDIMPAIRKTGSYKLHKSDKSKLSKINKKLSSIKKSNKSLKINQIHIDYPEGPHVYIIKQKANTKTYYKIGYTSNLNSRIKTYNTGNANKIYFNYIIKVTNQDIDNCIKKILRNKELIKNKEFYKITLKRALDYIHKCNNSLNKISCGYCLKSYKFNTILNHKCNL